MKHNWLNDTARHLNERIYQKTQTSPSTSMRAKWHQEFIDQGLDKRMSFVQYLKARTRDWYRQRSQKSR